LLLVICFAGLLLLITVAVTVLEWLPLLPLPVAVAAFVTTSCYWLLFIAVSIFVAAS